MERFRLRVLLPVLLAGLVLSACDSSPSGPDRKTEVTVMTRNIYVGAEITNLMLVQDPVQFPVEVALMWLEIQATNFAERAEALADEIEDADPDVIGLQEVSLFRYQTPGDFVLGGTTPADSIALDFLALLMDALEARSLVYSEAARVTDFDFEVPIGVPGLPWPDDIRLTDHDVILVKDGVEVGSTASGNYTFNLPLEVAGVEIEITRGWVSADVTVGGEEFRFVNTHLEPATSQGVPIRQLIDLQHVQAAELITYLDTSELPLVVVGDFNSPADGSLTTTYLGLLGWGLSDAWSSTFPAELGYTCCQDADLMNAASGLQERIDVILFTKEFIADSAEIVGEETADKTASMLWPSDHAGVWSVLRF